MYGIPVILKEGSKQKKNAISENIMAVRSISEAMRSTFGPKGLNKMIVTSFGDATVTNDCFTILDEMDFDHPAAKLIVQLSKSMHKYVGDGVTKALILVGELLRNAEELLDQKLHPNVIIKGYNKALKKALEVIQNESIDVDINDEKKILQIALTALSSKSTFGAADKLSDIATKAILKIYEKRGNHNYVDIDLVQIIKKEGSQLSESTFIEGLIVDKEVVNSTMPNLIKNAKIALINKSMEIVKTEFDTDIKITEPQKISEFKNHEDSMIKDMVQKIVESGANVIFCQKGIDELAQHYLALNNIMAVRRVKRSDMEKLTLSTHANIIADFKSITPEDLGSAERVIENQIGKDKMIFVEKCKNPKSISILIRGGTKQIIDDAERSIKNALNVVKNVVENPKIVAGAGAIEIEISKQIRNYAQTISTRDSIAVESFARAFEAIPISLSDNAGLNSMEILADLLAKHQKKSGNYQGIDLESQKTFDAMQAGIIEPSMLIEHAISSATELSIMLIRIDDTISSAKSGGGHNMPDQGASDYDD